MAHALIGFMYSILVPHTMLGMERLLFTRGNRKLKKGSGPRQLSQFRVRQMLRVLPIMRILLKEMLIVILEGLLTYI